MTDMTLTSFIRLRILMSLFLFGTALSHAQPAVSPEGFSIPQPGIRFVFPRDHGSHPAFALEWWYITGHLSEADGTAYGFQATFFRRACPKPLGPTTATPAFGDQQLFLAHMALLDGRTGRFLHQERIQREGWDAAASTNTLDLRNGSWSLQIDPAAVSTHGPTFLLSGGIRAEAIFSLKLEPIKPLVVFGTNGVSRKAADPSAASHYLTFSRLRISGSLRLPGRTPTVTGEAWMDHEFSSSQLGRDQIGWDWASLQLDDGREVMAYRMRRSDGTVDPFSTLAWVDRNGRLDQVGASAFGWESSGEWRSPHSAAAYPASIRLRTRDPETGQDRTFLLKPVAADQELTGSLGGIPYWEGACRVLDETGRAVGRAFLEMTGYAGTLQGRF